MKKIILILALLGVFQLNFGTTSKEYNTKGLKAYKEKDYSNAINNFYNAVIESEKDKNVTTEEKAGYYSDYALALIKGHLVEHGIFVALYSNNLTEDKKLRAANFYNISLALDMIEKNEWKVSDNFPESIPEYSKLAKDISLYLKDKAPQPKGIDDNSLMGSLIVESTYKDGKNSISKLELEDKFIVKYGEDKEKIVGNSVTEAYNSDELYNYADLNPISYYFENPTRNDLEKLGLEDLKFHNLYPGFISDEEVDINDIYSFQIKIYNSNLKIIDYESPYGAHLYKVLLDFKNNNTFIDNLDNGIHTKVYNLLNWKTGETNRLVEDSFETDFYKPALKFVLKKGGYKISTKNLKVNKIQKSPYISEEVIRYYLGLESNYDPKYKFKGIEDEDPEYENFSEKIVVDYRNLKKESTVIKYAYGMKNFPIDTFVIDFPSVNLEFFINGLSDSSDKLELFLDSYLYEIKDIFFIEKDGKIITYFLFQSNGFKKITFIGLEFNGDKFKKVDEVEVEMEWEN